MFDQIQVPDSVQLPKGQPACRRKADALRAAYRLHHQFAAFSADEEDVPRWQAQPGQRLLFNIDKLAEKKEWLTALAGDNQKALVKSFEKLEEIGPWRYVAQAPEPKVLDVLHVDFSNFSAVTTLIQQRLLLCRLAPEKLIRLPPILLDGPPGVGKTAYCQRLANLLGLRFEALDLSSAAASFSMTGLDAGYSTRHPGRIWESLQHDSLSVLWLLDEVEKSQNAKLAGNAWLLGLLEPVSARRYEDSCTLLPIDASWICYIATSNDRDLIDPPLLNRFTVFDIQSPDATQMQAIVRSIHRDIRHSEAWAPVFGDALAESVIDTLIGYSPREIRRRLIDGFAAAAAQSRRVLQASDISGKPAAHADRRMGFL